MLSQLVQKFQKKKKDTISDLYEILVRSYGENYQEIRVKYYSNFHLFKGEKMNVIVCFMDFEEFIPTAAITSKYQNVQRLIDQGYKIDRVVFATRGTRFNLDFFEWDAPKIKWKSLAKQSKESILDDIKHLTDGDC